jgi:hypothetical protein
MSSVEVFVYSEKNVFRLIIYYVLNAITKDLAVIVLLLL